LNKKIKVYKDWEKKYKELREIYIRTRFEFERVDSKLKEELLRTGNILNQVEEQFKQKSKVIFFLFIFNKEIGL